MKFYKTENDGGRNLHFEGDGAHVMVRDGVNDTSILKLLAYDDSRPVVNPEDITAEEFIEATVHVMAKQFGPLWPAVAAQIAAVGVKRCIVCGNPVQDKRAKYCSGACKTAAWRSGISDADGDSGMPPLPAELTAPALPPFRRWIHQSWLSILLKWDGHTATVTATKTFQGIEAGRASLQSDGSLVQVQIESLGRDFLLSMGFDRDKLLFHGKVFMDIIGAQLTHGPLPWPQSEEVTDTVTLKEVAAALGGRMLPSEWYDSHKLAVAWFDAIKPSIVRQAIPLAVKMNQLRSNAGKYMRWIGPKPR